MMVYKLFTIIFINIIILSTITYSIPQLPHDDIIKGQENEFFCNGSNITCCPNLAHRIASDNHSRCASIILVNKSGYNLTLETVNLEDGRWITMEDYGRFTDIYCEPHSILNGESEAISSVTSHFLGGVLGFVTFNMDDDISSKIVISWDVPTVGFPGYHFNFDNVRSENKYIIKSENSFGDTVFRIEIHERIPWTWSSIPTYILVPLFIFFIGIPVGCILLFCMEEMTRGTNRRQEHAPFRLQERLPYGQQGRLPYGQQGRLPYGQQGQRLYDNNHINQQPRRQSYNSTGQHNKQQDEFF